MRALSKVCLLWLLFSTQAWAVLEIDITQGVQGLPIAVNPFSWQGDGDAPLDLAKIVDANLARSGQFSPLSREDMLSQPNSIFEVRFADWRALGMNYLLIGKLRFIAETKRYQVEFRLYDVQQSQQIEGRLFSSIKASQLRRVAHNISDLVYEKITGMPGAFNTLVCFISADGIGKKRRFKLHVADSDGHAAKTILSSKEPLMSPSWSPDGRRLAYVSFEKAKAAIYVQQINSGKREQVAAFKGINGAPSWSPDGKSLAVTLSYKGNPDIYLLDLQSKKLQQLTGNSAIDTEPVWTPDGHSIIFTSDRSGGPQLYEIAVTGGRAKRLTFEGNYNSSAAISANGQHIALLHRQQGQYQIAVLERKSGFLRILTDGSLDESPSFAPNGSMILYASSYRGRGILGAVSLDGRMKQRLSLSGNDVREPVWSPYLK